MKPFRLLSSFLLGKRLKGWKRVLFLLVSWIPLSLMAFVVLCNVLVVWSTHSFIARDVDSARANEVALILGTSKKISPDQGNRHFENRIRRAGQLYRAEKVKHLLVSGDNGSRYYNEPNDMRDALEDLGVPRSQITRDFAGFRTLDSMVRAHEIFQLEAFTVVSDGFHLPRAIFIGRHFGLDVVGVASEPVPIRQALKTHVRECLARVKAVLDVYVLDTVPRYGGKPEPIMVSR